MSLSEHLRSLSHHAYCIVGGEPVRDELVSILEKKHKIKIKGNPDLFDRRYETFSIDDARELKSLVETKPVSDDSLKIFVITATGMTVEAQNALLKLLEEPPEYARFFLVVPSAGMLLPTVRSRMAVIGDGASGGDRYGKDATAEAEAFLKATLAKRLDIVKALMDDISKEKKAKADAVALLDGLEAALHSGGVKKNAAALEAVEKARNYAADRAPSMKMLLEFVAMSV